jgi:hypothetical protein
MLMQSSELSEVANELSVSIVTTKVDVVLPPSGIKNQDAA